VTLVLLGSKKDPSHVQVTVRVVWAPVARECRLATVSNEDRWLTLRGTVEEMRRFRDAVDARGGALLGFVERAQCLQRIRAVLG